MLVPGDLGGDCEGPWNRERMVAPPSSLQLRQCPILRCQPQDGVWGEPRREPGRLGSLRRGL